MPIVSSKLSNSPVNKGNCSHFTQEEKDAGKDEKVSYFRIVSTNLRSHVHLLQTLLAVELHGDSQWGSLIFRCQAFPSSEYAEHIPKTEYILLLKASKESSSLQAHPPGI